MKKPYHSPKLKYLDSQACLADLEAAAKAGDVTAQKMLQHSPKQRVPDERVLNPIGA